MGQKGKRGIADEVGRVVVFGVISAIIAMMILCFVGAELLSKEVLPQESVEIISIIICAVGMLIGCRIAIGKSKHGALPVSLGCAAGSLLLLYFGRLIIKSDTTFGWQNLGVGIAAAVAAAFLWSSRKGK